MTTIRIRRPAYPLLTLAATASIAFSATLATLALPALPAMAAPAQQGRAQPTSAENKPQVVDLNTADLDALTTVPGIGPALAQRIIEYRKEHGPFKKVEDLLNVRGIGERSLARIKDRVTVGGKS
jgi:competence protein ComEA